MPSASNLLIIGNTIRAAIVVIIFRGEGGGRRKEVQLFVYVFGTGKKACIMTLMSKNGGDDGIFSSVKL